MGLRIAHEIRMAKWQLSAVAVSIALSACGAISSSLPSAVNVGGQSSKTSTRLDAIARAQVWQQTNVAAMDIRSGPTDTAAFKFLQTVNCDYLPKQLSGGSPKFACKAGDDELKVKFGGNNAEVYGEVAATRLLWALGFGADHMYSVRVVCRGCPSVLGGIVRENNEMLFDPATIERKMPGRELEPDSFWSWTELDQVGERGAPRAHRDALKLLAVFLQHTDTKPEQQRIVCAEAKGGEGEGNVCDRPFMMVSDVGLTFGRANLFNTNSKGMHYVQWAATPVWKDGPGCVGNLPKSATGTLRDPVISEEGRAFLAGLLTQLTDDQIRALFEVSRVTLRLRDPGKAKSGFATVDEWTEVFKRKRADIVDRKCA
jgi:hypothetical protein